MAPRHSRRPTRRKHALPELGPADGPVKHAIFGDNNARLYKFMPRQRATLEKDRFSQIKETYDRHGGDRGNLFYGYVHKPAA